MAHQLHKHRALSKPKHLHKREHRHYWPYIPLLLVVITSFLVSILAGTSPRNGVLAYSTSMSTDQLLVATNQQRQQNRSGDLQLNQTLTAAAQAKANDMVARNYWSHNTPDGKEPWVFVSNAGYKYLKAGENLAYGFSTSDDAVIGWMNSPAHRDNLLDSSFSDVGFGFANGPDFNGHGPETVVVAMYGKPQSAAVLPQITPSSAPTTPLSVSSNAKALPVSTDHPTSSQPASTQIGRIQTITGGRASWTMLASGIAIGVSLMILLIKHAVGIRHIISNSERFVLHHPMLDTLLVSTVILGSLMSRTVGFIR